jgi:outer membrane protein assembly factor BamB
LIAPLVVDGTVYTVDEVLTALNARTGEREWQTDLGIEESPNSATQPAVADGTLVLASDSRLRSFDTADGSKQWERTITGSPAQPVTVASDQQMGFTFFRRPEEGELPTELVAFGIETGETEWTAPLSAPEAPPAVFDDHVYVAGWGGPETQVLRCLRLDDGKLVWERDIGDRTTPPVSTGVGVLIGDGTDITIYNHSDGERLASISVSLGQIRALAIDDGTAFVLAESGLSAVSVPDGSEQWSLSEEESSDYAQANGLAVGREAVVAPVFPDSDSTPSIAAFDKTDGTPQWYYTIDDGWSPTIVAPPVIADGAVFAMTNTKSGVTALGDLPPRTEETDS